MKSLLILPRIKVEAANAISGLTYGFPSVTHFLGFVHALSRELEIRYPRTKKGVGALAGCAIVCHHHQILCHKTGAGGEQVFSLTRNPLTKEGGTAPFNEEGKVHIEVSLLIECNFTLKHIDFDEDDTEEEQKFLKEIKELVFERRLAGGIITEMSMPKLYGKENVQKSLRRILRQMLPGFVLIDRSDSFEHYLSENLQLSSLEAMLDFCALKSKSGSSSEIDAESGKVEWKYVSKPLEGWIVPLQIGYKAISPLYEAGKVACVRNPDVPFRFVEPVYGLGEWKGPHLIDNIESIIWRYQYDGEQYVCSNSINNES